MLKRFFAFFVSICLVFVFVCSSFVSLAVAPVALVEAALASYVASTGYKIWVENGTGQDLLSFMSDLYSEFDDAFSGQYMTMLELGSGNYVYSDNSGHIILSKTAVDIFQDFADWLKTEYSIPTDNTVTNVVSAPSSNLCYFGNLDGQDIYALKFTFGPVLDHDGNTLQLTDPIGTMGDLVTPVRIQNIANGPGYCYVFRISNGYYALLPPGFSGHFTFAYAYSGYGSPPYWWPAGFADLSDSSWTLVQRVGVPDESLPLGPSYIPPSSYTTLLSGGSLGASLALSLGQAILDKANDVANDYSLVIDVGAASGASDQAIVDAVIAGYNGTTGELTVIDSVVATEVIDTPVQPYPDLDSLGLPELGLALTTRFPFSIPWDISAIYSALSAPSEPPVKTFDLIPASVLTRWGINANTSITIDLTEQKYSVLLAIIHWSCIIGFCLGLAVMTKRYIWTTGG